MNPPNLITLGRVILVPAGLLAARHRADAGRVLPFIVAGVSDAVDGWLAKSFGWTTELGAYLDPLADKLLIVSIFLALGVGGKLPLWLVITVVSRDILIVIAVVSVVAARKSGAHPPADREQGQYGGADHARRHGAGG